jgi:hypothetical protein
VGDERSGSDGLVGPGGSPEPRGFHEPPSVRWSVGLSFRESNSGDTPPTGTVDGTSRNQSTTRKSSNKRPSSTRPHDFRETERESGGLAPKWAGMGSGETSCCWSQESRRKSQPRLRAGRDVRLAGHRLRHAHYGVETFDTVYSVELRGIEPLTS